MTNQHPITPPPELVEQLEAETAHTTKDETWHVAVQAARWGADQELKACCEWLDESTVGMAELLRIARRPKLPSLKEQALAALENDDIDIYLIRQALEALPND